MCSSLSPSLSKLRAKELRLKVKPRMVKRMRIPGGCELFLSSRRELNPERSSALSCPRSAILSRKLLQINLSPFPLSPCQLKPYRFNPCQLSPYQLNMRLHHLSLITMRRTKERSPPPSNLSKRI